MAIAGSAAGSRTVMFETLYMYNFLTGEMVPLLADGDYSWNAEKTELTVKINPAAKWSDGAAVTAIYAQCPPDAGLGLAVANRLKKAAGFQVVDLGEGEL